MAALLQPADNSEHVTPREESFNEETLDQSCDVILVVEDGKEFKAHKRVLSEASPFFEKLFNSDMKESKEGMVRLEMFSESVMRNTLGFIYTGGVQILAEHNARDLIVIADYLLLDNLRTLAEEVLVQSLNISNCISAYYVSQRYPQCEGLFAKTKTFILANFSAVYEANRDEVLNMSSKEIEMWISSDEIDVSAEEDIFKMILAWIDCDKSERNKYFAELFRQVRLVYVSRDFLCSDIVTNELVKYNEDCMDLVADAMKLIDCKNYDNLSVTPRKSLETPVIVTDSLLRSKVESGMARSCDILCYFPRDGRWCSLGKRPDFVPKEERHRMRGWPGSSGLRPHGLSDSCRGKLYNISKAGLESYNPYSNCWSLTSSLIPYTDDRDMCKLFVAEDEIYALVDDRLWAEIYGSKDGKKPVSYITKYKHESNSWEDISSFDHLDPRRDVCIVAKDHFVYLIGGVGWLDADGAEWKLFADVNRYDLSRNQWEKVANMQEPKLSPSGAVANGKIFITEAGKRSSKPGKCEVYNETTNEWQFIARINIPHELGVFSRPYPWLLSADGKLYALAINQLMDDSLVIQCYDPDKNEWNCEIEIPSLFSTKRRLVHAYSLRIFKGFLSELSEPVDSGNEML